MAFSCTVLSTMTLFRLCCLITLADAAAQMVWANNHCRPSASMRCRQRVSELGSMGG